MDKVAVLIPCYNEEKTIGKVVSDYRRVLPEAIIYVYDNNSQDDTIRCARQAGAVVRREYEQGKGNVMRRMFREIDAQVYLIVDGDDTYPAECAAEMVRLVAEEQVDMVIGDRLSATYFQENKRPFHNVGNKLVRRGINLLFHADIRDIMTGYRAMSYQFVKTFPVLSRGFEIETEMTIHAVDKNMSIRNVIVDYRDRPQGSVSKLNTYQDGFKVLRTMGKLFIHYKPFLFYSVVAGLLSVLSAVFVVPVVVHYIQSGLVERVPTLIVCGFAFLAALLALFSGCILSRLNTQFRQNFEMQLIRTDQAWKSLQELQEKERDEPCR